MAGRRVRAGAERGRRATDDGALRVARRERGRARRDARRVRQTGGLTGAEVAVAGGTTAAGQRILEALLGDQAVRTLAARARELLLTRTRALLAGEAERFESLLAPVTPQSDAAQRLRQAVRNVEPAR